MDALINLYKGCGLHFYRFSVDTDISSLVPRRSLKTPGYEAMAGGTDGLQLY